MSWTKTEIRNMIEELNEISKHEYIMDKSYDGYKLEVKIPGGTSSITKNNRYNRNEFGQFLSDLISFVKREGDGF